MNGTALNKTDIAAWRSLIARPDATKLLIAAAFYFISALIIPFTTNEALALVFVVACAVLYYTQTRTLASLIAPAIPAVVLFSLSGSMMLPAAFFAIVFGGACGAMLLITAKDPKRDAVLVLLPIAAYAAAWLLRGDPVNALLTLLPLPVAMAAAIAVRRCAAFTASVAAIAAALAAALLLAGGVTLALMDLFDIALLPELLQWLETGIMTTMEETRALYAEMGVTIELQLSEADIHNLLATLTNLSPAIFAVLSLITAYFTWRTLSLLLVSFGALPRLPRLLVTPTMSVTSAILFLVAYLTALIANAENGTLAGAAAHNIALVLEPGLALVGIGQVLGQSGSRSCVSFLILIVLVYFIWASPAVALMAAAVCGAVHVLVSAYQQMKNSKGEQ